MAFNPLQEKGLPLEQQMRSWRELNVEPFDPDAVHPYTRCRVIVMNGIEVEALLFSHNFARHTNDKDLQRQLALSRYMDHQQQKVVNWLFPGWSSVLETTIAYEQVASDLTAWVARNEPDAYFKQAYDFGLLEDFDHLYRYANLYEMIEHRKAEKNVDELTEIIPGRPTRAHHRHPFDNVREGYDRVTADPLSKLHQLTITAAEQQTLNFYANVGPQYMEPIARQLYQEIGLVEEEHVTHYESMGDGSESWFRETAAARIQRVLSLLLVLRTGGRSEGQAGLGEFNRIRQHLPSAQRAAMRGLVKAAEAVAPTRPHPSAQSATGNLLLGLPLAFIDRVRDAIRAARGKDVPPKERS